MHFFSKCIQEKNQKKLFDLSFKSLSKKTFYAIPYGILASYLYGIGFFFLKINPTPAYLVDIKGPRDQDRKIT